MTLILTPNIKNHDRLYQSLIDAHAGLSDTQSAELNSRLVLILFNHIGDEEILAAALEAACRSNPARQQPRDGSKP